MILETGRGLELGILARKSTINAPTKIREPLLITDILTPVTYFKYKEKE